MIKIRESTFETNSSSSHSLVVTKGDTSSYTPENHYTPEEAWDEIKWDMENEKHERFCDDACVYTPKWCDMYYGRYPFRVLMSFEDKLKYAYANAPIRRSKKPNKNGYYSYSREYYKITRKINKFLPKFKKVDFSLVESIGTDETYLSCWLKALNIDLIKFLTNKHIFVICDGDEYCVWTDMKKSGLININNIETEI